MVHPFSVLCSILRILSSKPVLMAVRFHLFPSRTQKLSSPVSKILGWRRPGKIERCRYFQKPKSSFYTGFLVYIPPMADKVRHGLELRRNEYSSLAQSVERSAVNRNVVGSSPTGGASLRKETQTEHRASGAPIVGVDGGGGTPVPIPNTAVKPICAHDTWLEAAWENR